MTEQTDEPEQRHGFASLINFNSRPTHPLVGLAGRRETLMLREWLLRTTGFPVHRLECQLQNVID
jgi:hypothetical protein